MTQINESLIRQYAAGATPDGIRNLLTLMDFLARQTTRAEELSRAYLAQMTVLQKRLTDAREGQEGRAEGRAESRAVRRAENPPRSKPPRAPAHTPASTDAIEIDL